MSPYRYQPADNTLYIKNRQKLIEKLEKGSLALLCSNEVIPSNADGILGFKQNSDLFYLSGIDQEETILCIMPSHPNLRMREVLFIRETSDFLKTWEGEKLSKEMASALSGIATVLWTSQFDSFLKRAIPETEVMYLNTNEHDGRNKSFVTKSDVFNGEILKFFPLVQVKRLAPLLTDLRTQKEPEELKQIKKAIEISRVGFEHLAKSLKPGIFEFELEAGLTHQFLKQRSRGHAFQPIIASGANACVLHYISNNETCKEGELVLFDFGAEYGNYNADISRCLPVSGKFTSRQKDIYQAVLRIFHFAKKRMIPDNTFENLAHQVGQCVTEELIALGILSEQEVMHQHPDNPLYKKYFPHGVSHFLGLDVHDVGSRYAVFTPGMLLTCEPGLYIPQEGIGIRLENDILITENGNEDLCAHIPIEIEEIENLMNQK